jgi:hypothetical protein
MRNNEPVAWRNLCVSNIGEDSEWIYNEIGQGEPLYTHPVKELTAQEVMEQTHKKISEAHWQVKELTDEEIYEVWHDLYERWEEEDTLKFARAILRKAQEK